MCLFSVSLFLSPFTFFGLPLFLFLFLCLSLALVFLSSFLSFFFAFFLFLVFVSLFHFSFFFAFVSRKEQHENINLHFFHQSFLFLWFLVLLFLSNPFALSLFLPHFKLCSLFNMNVLISQQTTLKTHFFGEKGGCNKTFFLSTCVLQNVKSYRFFCQFFGPILVDVQNAL